MKTYETTYIISSQVSGEHANIISKEIEGFIQSKEGVILKSDMPDKAGRVIAQTLAYNIKKQSSGFFVTLAFQILEDKIKELNESLGKNKDVLRHFIVIKKPIKILKKRRTKKPLKIAEEKSTYLNTKSFTDFEKKESDKIELDKIDKKLDEILGE